MNYFSMTMKIISALLMAYMFVIMIRIFLSWFPVGSEGMMRIRNLVHKLTDPYMKHFRNISWLQFGMMDFSPILALGLLSVALFITDSLSDGAIPTTGMLLVLILSLIWSIIAFLLLILGIIMIIRLITLYTIKGRRSDWTDRLDGFLFPRVSKILGLFTRKPLNYPVALGISAATLLALRFGIGILLQQFFPILARI